MNKLKTALLFTALSILPATAGLMVQYENAGVAASTVPFATNVFTFDGLPVANPNNTPPAALPGIGVLTNFAVIGANQYGGAGGTGEYAGSSTPATLNFFNTGTTYFGLWLSAVDSSDLIAFYKDGEVVASYDSERAVNELSSAYNGNPFNDIKSNEKFVFINFLGTEGFSWDRIDFSGSNFEGDNFTGLSAVPEPGSLMALGGLIGSSVFFRSRRRPAKV